RGVGIAGVINFQRAVCVFHQPGPARAKVANSRVVELLLERFKGTECLVDGFSDCTSGLTAAIGAQAVPEESVVPDLGRVVENRALRAVAEVSQGLAFNLGAGNQLIELGD